MVEPVLGSVFDKRNVTDIILVDAIVQTKKYPQAGLCKDCMCRLEDDVIPGDVPA
jgi:hypothetical protein